MDKQKIWTKELSEEYLFKLERKFDISQKFKKNDSVVEGGFSIEEKQKIPHFLIFEYQKNNDLALLVEEIINLRSYFLEEEVEDIVKKISSLPIVIVGPMDEAKIKSRYLFLNSCGIYFLDYLDDENINQIPNFQGLSSKNREFIEHLLFPIMKINDADIHKIKNDLGAAVLFRGFLVNERISKQEKYPKLISKILHLFFPKDISINQIRKKLKNAKNNSIKRIQGDLHTLNMIGDIREKKHPLIKLLLSCIEQEVSTKVGNVLHNPPYNLKLPKFQNKILFIDDNAQNGWETTLQCIFGQNNLDTYNPNSLKEIEDLLIQLEKKDLSQYEFVLLDLWLLKEEEKASFDEKQNLQSYLILEKIKQCCPELPIVIFSATNNIKTYKTVIEIGAFSFYAKAGRNEYFSEKLCFENLQSLVEIAKDIQLYNQTTRRLFPKNFYSWEIAKVLGTNQKRNRLERLLQDAWRFLSRAHDKDYLSAYFSQLLIIFDEIRYNEELEWNWCINYVRIFIKEIRNIYTHVHTEKSNSSKSFVTYKDAFVCFYFLISLFTGNKESLKQILYQWKRIAFFQSANNYATVNGKNKFSINNKNISWGGFRGLFYDYAYLMESSQHLIGQVSNRPLNSLEIAVKSILNSRCYEIVIQEVNKEKRINLSNTIFACLANRTEVQGNFYWPSKNEVKTEEDNIYLLPIVKHSNQKLLKNLDFGQSAVLRLKAVKKDKKLYIEITDIQ